MAVFKPRTRIVSFRLSEEEYEDLKTVCMTHGARSISDFARFATRQWVSGEGKTPDEVLQQMLRQLNGKVKRIDGELKRLAQMVHRT